MKSSVTSKVLAALKKGQTLTTKQICARYGVVNGRDPIYNLEENGVRVDREYRKQKNGYSTVRYSLA